MTERESGKLINPKDIITEEEYKHLRAMFAKPNGEEMLPHEIEGFYTKKTKYGVKNVNDFI